MQIQDDIYDSSAVLWNTQQSWNYTILQHCDEMYDHVLAVQNMPKVLTNMCGSSGHFWAVFIWSCKYYLYKNNLCMFLLSFIYNTTIINVTSDFADRTTAIKCHLQLWHTKWGTAR